MTDQPLQITYEHVIGQKELECIELRMNVAQLKNRVKELEDQLAQAQANESEPEAKIVSAA